MAYAGGRAILIVSLVLCAVNPPYVNAEQATQINAPQLLIPNPDIPVLASNPGEVTLRWTAPGDDGNIGTANHYIVRYSSNPITESNWGSAITIPNPPAPLPAGSAQSFTFSGLPMGTAYYFAIKTFDEAGNSSALSNVIRKFTGGIQTPALAGESVDTTRALAVLDADTVAAPVRLKYQFALDSIRSFPNPRIAADSLVDSLASVTYSSLGHGHRYFWRCRAMAFDNSDSSLWSYADSFYMPQAISDTPRVVVSSPNGGERWNIGSSHPITWSATDSGGVTSYAIDYSTNAGTNWVSIVPQTNGNPLAFNWTVPATPSVTCLVRVRAWDPSGNVGNDVSNAVFAISTPPDSIPPVVAVTSPNGGERLRPGATRYIKWTDSDNVGVTMNKMEYSTNSGVNWLLIRDWTSGDPQIYTWIVPNTPSATCRVRVSVGDGAGNIASDISDADFTIRTRGNVVIASQSIAGLDTQDSEFDENMATPPLFSQGGSAIPSEYFLGQSYPNPFNAVTRIDYGLPAASYVNFEIYDITGRHVETLVNEYQEAGYHSLTWNSSNEPSGVYLYHLTAGFFSQTMKMTVLK